MRVRRFKRHSDKRNGIQEIDRTVLCLTAQAVSIITLAPTLWFGCRGRISRSGIPRPREQGGDIGRWVASSWSRPLLSKQSK